MSRLKKLTIFSVFIFATMPVFIVFRFYYGLVVAAIGFIIVFFQLHRELKEKVILMILNGKKNECSREEILAMYPKADRILQKMHAKEIIVLKNDRVFLAATAIKEKKIVTEKK